MQSSIQARSYLARNIKKSLKVEQNRALEKDLKERVRASCQAYHETVAREQVKYMQTRNHTDAQQNSSIATLSDAATSSALSQTADSPRGLAKVESE